MVLTPYYTCPEVRACSFDYLIRYVKGDEMSTSVNPDQTAP